jgi:large subunit ribosomal protein L17
LSVRYRERAGGYTRIVKLGFRAGDSAPVSLVEFVKDGEKEKSRKKTGAAKKS